MENSHYRTGHGKKSIFPKKKLSHKLFGGSGKLGKKTKFGLAAGAGFLGGAAAGVAGMEVYHRYKQYKAMMHYKVIRDICINTLSEITTPKMF